jgi:hypothetical protein
MNTSNGTETERGNDAMDDVNSLAELSDYFEEEWSQQLLMPEPNDHDILPGRGSNVNNNPGNVRFIELSREAMHKYETAEKGQKKAVSEKIVQQLRREGRRFIYRSGDSWGIMDDKQAVAKTSSAIRDQISGSSRHSNQSYGDQSLYNREDAMIGSESMLYGSHNMHTSHLLGDAGPASTLYQVPPDVSAQLPQPGPQFQWALCLIPSRNGKGDGKASSMSGITHNDPFSTFSEQLPSSSHSRESAWGEFQRRNTV